MDGIGRYNLRAYIAVSHCAHVCNRDRRDDDGEDPNWTCIWLSALFLATLAGVGHTQVEHGFSYAVHVIADGIHLLAAGAWLGGLIPLGYIVSRSVLLHSTSAAKEAEDAAIHFSGVGYAAVAALIGSGVINSWF